MNAIVKAVSFEERLKEKIRKDIGDMITDEDLKNIVNKSLQDVFFTPRTVPDGRYHTKELPPLIHELVKDALMPAMQLAINEWMKDNSEYVEKAIKDVVQQGAGTAIISALDAKFAAPLQYLGIQIQQLSNR